MNLHEQERKALVAQARSFVDQANRAEIVRDLRQRDIHAGKCLEINKLLKDTSPVYDGGGGATPLAEVAAEYVKYVGRAA